MIHAIEVKDFVSIEIKNESKRKHLKLYKWNEVTDWMYSTCACRVQINMSWKKKHIGYT